MKRQFVIFMSLLVVAGMLQACTPEETSGPAFEEIELAVEFAPKDALLVLDRSKSMLGNGFLPYVASSIEALTLEMEDYVNFGLMVYPGVGCTDSANSCDVPTEPYVPFDHAVSNVAQINDVLTGWGNNPGTCGATPTAATLEAAQNYLAQLDNGAQKMIILATDGAPNCNDTLDGPTCVCTDAEQGVCSGDAGQCLDDDATTDAAGALEAAGIPVYVLSLGDGGKDLPEQFAGVMDAIAVAGGTQGALTAQEVADVEAKISELQPELYSCELDVDWSNVAQFDKESKISNIAEKISLFGKESKESKISEINKISYDPGCTTGEGFDLISNDKISLCSSLCDQFKESKISDFAATFKESKISKESTVAKESLP